jgi:hypothetical protein
MLGQRGRHPAQVGGDVHAGPGHDAQQLVVGADVGVDGAVPVRREEVAEERQKPAIGVAADAGA